MWIADQVPWLLCCAAAAVWPRVTVCSPYDRLPRYLLYVRLICWMEIRFPALSACSFFSLTVQHWTGDNQADMFYMLQYTKMQYVMKEIEH